MYAVRRSQSIDHKRTCRPVGVDEEGHALNGIGGTVHILLDGQGLLWRIVEHQGLRVLMVDHHRLNPGGFVDGVARNRPGLLYHNGAGHAGDVELAVAAGGIQAVGGQMPVGVVHIAAAGIGQFKLHPGQRLFCDGIQFADDQFAGLFVPKRELLHSPGLDFDVLWRAVQHKTLHSYGLVVYLKIGCVQNWFSSKENYDKR